MHSPFIMASAWLIAHGAAALSPDEKRAAYETSKLACPGGNPENAIVLFKDKGPRRRASMEKEGWEVPSEVMFALKLEQKGLKVADVIERNFSSALHAILSHDNATLEAAIEDDDVERVF